MLLYYRYKHKVFDSYGPHTYVLTHPYHCDVIEGVTSLEKNGQIYHFYGRQAYSQGYIFLPNVPFFPQPKILVVLFLPCCGVYKYDSNMINRSEACLGGSQSHCSLEKRPILIPHWKKRAILTGNSLEITGTYVQKKKTVISSIIHEKNMPFFRSTLLK